MFQPVLPLSGYAGWRFLEQTLDAQKTAHAESPLIERQTDRFRERIGSIARPADLVADRQLLEVALGAFGLGDDIDNKFFIRRILEDDLSDPKALANRLSDARYGQFAATFDFTTDQTAFSDPAFAEDIIARFETAKFAEAVGDQNEDFRLALNVSEGIDDVLAGSSNDEARWFSILGSPPLRSVFETALGLPASFSQINLDQQLETLRDKSERIFGADSVEIFVDPEAQDKLVRLFLVRSEASASAVSAGQIALSLLSGVAS
ncbi:DUF1217 domain-containing protein [Aestuariibius sp. 2305UL40-4]|uniref:DUF1217 domain-containing protein n=1 Tax=Aestuariibius violaceus TaxID=3234132 RepID=UPI00345E6BD2